MNYKVLLYHPDNGIHEFRSTSRNSMKLLKLFQGNYCEIRTPKGKLVSVSRWDGISPRYDRKYERLLSMHP